jgi:DNA-binding CsgD family transcriptional regulator
MLIGREAETARLEQLLAAARLGTSGALLLRGVAGIGKTALLAAAEAQAAEEGFLVLRATGIESEEELPYATLHQLLRPLEDRIDRLAELQAAALRGALGLGTERQADRFLVGVGTLTLLADAAEEQPVLALLDDAGWFDHASLDALSFTARRLHAEGIVLLFAVRDEPDRRFALPGVRELRVNPLGDADAQRLLGDGIDVRRRDEVIVRAAGNPLALIELGRPSTDGAPLAGGAEQAYADRIRSLPEETRALLLLAAADTTTSVTVVSAAAAQLGIDGARALEPAETAGLVHAVGGGIEFRHPLVRSAAYHSAPFARRARAHLALADVLRADDDADRRAWHHASAVLGADDEVAAELERTADRALVRGGQAAAATALERAGELSAGPEARARRLVAAGFAAGMAGEPDRALELIGSVDTSRDPRLAAASALIRGTITMNRGSSRDAFEWFLEAVRAGAEADTATALQAVIRATDAAWQANLGERMPELRAATAAIRPSTDDERANLAVAQGFAAFMDGDFEFAHREFRRGAGAAEGSSDPLTLLHASWASAFAADAEGGRRLVTRAEELARASGAIGALPVLMTSRAGWEFGVVPFTDVDSSLMEALTVAREIGQASQTSLCLGLLARVDAARGNADACRERAAEARSLGQKHGLSQPESAADYALATLDLALGDAAAALERLQAILSDGHVAYHYAAIDDLVEAAARVGRPEEGQEAARLWARSFGATGMPLGDAIASRARALLAPPEEADVRYREALAVHEQTSWRFLHARTELAYGEFLRRQRRKTEARTQLRSAFERFEALDASPWADRAASELRATGETARKRDASTLAQLTPQELQIARLVAEGGRNREIAARLFLSPKTVEYHLRKVFQKLDIASRNDLIRLFAGGQAPPELVVAAP